MIDPFTFRQITEIKHRERLEQYTRRRPARKVRQEAARPASGAWIVRAWALLRRRLSPVLGR